MNTRAQTKKMAETAALLEQYKTENELLNKSKQDLMEEYKRLAAQVEQLERQPIFMNIVNERSCFRDPDDDDSGYETDEYDQNQEAKNKENISWWARNRDYILFAIFYPLAFHSIGFLAKKFLKSEMIESKCQQDPMSLFCLH